MPYGLYLSAEGAHAQSLRLDVIANNLANVDTVGFKRELAVMQARYAEGISQGLVSAGAGGLEDVGGGVTVRQTQTQYSRGPLQDTGNSTDVAIKGEGFFVVKKGEETYLTRAGNFRITDSGELVTQQGHAVLDASGSPLAINPADRSWVDNLGLVQPGSLGDLVRVGENLFRPLAEYQPIPPEERCLVTGYLEGSGVKPTVEMTEMIQASRALEANVNMMKTQDEMLSGLVNRAMRVS